MPLIRCMGLLWHEEDVWWGRGRGRGTILGVAEKAKRGEPIDFADQVGIYALYADFDLVYVGQAGSGGSKLISRLRRHRRNQLAGRWNRFSWFGTRWVKANGKLSAETQSAHPSVGDVLDHMEAILIHTAEPPLNSQGGRWGNNCPLFRQVRDQRLGPPPEQMMREMWESERREPTR